MVKRDNLALLVLGVYFRNIGLLNVPKWIRYYYIITSIKFRFPKVAIIRYVLEDDSLASVIQNNR